MALLSKEQLTHVDVVIIPLPALHATHCDFEQKILVIER
jgi:hypothetical protein